MVFISSELKLLFEDNVLLLLDEQTMRSEGLLILDVKRAVMSRTILISVSILIRYGSLD